MKLWLCISEKLVYAAKGVFFFWYCQIDAMHKQAECFCCRKAESVFSGFNLLGLNSWIIYIIVESNIKLNSRPSYQANKRYVHKFLFSRVTMFRIGSYTMSATMYSLGVFVVAMLYACMHKSHNAQIYLTIKNKNQSVTISIHSAQNVTIIS